MADVTKNIHVRVVTFDPAQEKIVPVPDATLLVEDDGWFYNPDLSSGNDVSGADGNATLDITYKDKEENSLNPFFRFELAADKRQVPSGASADRRMSLPGDWVTQHDAKRSLPRISEHSDPNNVLEVFYGLPAALQVSYTDFHPSGIRNPLALPANTTRVHLADYDTFLFIDFLNPDDTLKGFGFDPKAGKTISIGSKDEYPYFDIWPTEPAARDGLPATPRAWIDPPEAPVGTLGGGSFVQTGPVAVDPHGFVFMIDGNVVRRFYPDGTLCETIDPGPANPLNAPRGIALDQYRNLFVADTGNHQIVILEPNWLDGDSGVYSRVTAFGAHGNGDAQFDGPQGLAVVPNRVVDGDELLAVADTGNDRVQLLTISVAGAPPLSRWASRAQTAALAPLTRFGATGNAADQFTEPVGVAADRERRIYVCDRALHRVSRWRPDPAGPGYLHDVTWEKAGGGAGNGAAEFDTPQALAIDTKNKYVYVAEEANHRVQRLDADSGNHLAHWTHVYAPALANPFTPTALAVDGRGEIFVADTANQRVLRATMYDGGATGAGAGTPLADNAVPVVAGQPWTPRTEPGHLDGPAYVTFAPDGRLWASDKGNNRVVAFERNAAGELVPVAPAPALAGLSGPIGVAVDVDGSIFVVDSANHRVRRYDAAFAHQADIGAHGAGPGQFDTPHGLALVTRAEKRLYVADRNNNRVQIVKLDGTFVGEITTGNGVAFVHPEDVAVDAKGNLYVADTGNVANARIVQFDATDTFVREIKLGSHALTFGQPCGIAVDEEGKLLVTDRALDAVFRIESDGDLLAFWNLNALVRMRTLTTTKAPKKGAVTLAAGVVTEAYTAVYGPDARLVTTGGNLTLTPDDGSVAFVRVLNAGDLIFVKNNDKIKADKLLFARLAEVAYYPEQARMQRFAAPSRAVMDPKGLLVVADTAHDRLRLVRTRTNVLTTLFDLGEGLPDISFRAVMDTDRSAELGLKVEIANVPFDGASIVLKNIPVLWPLLGLISTIALSSNDFVAEPEDNFSDDRYTGRFQLGQAKLVNGAINTLKVIYSAQRWLQHLTREDEAAHRWGDPSRTLKLLVDLLRRPGSFQHWFADTINLGSDETGRGVDTWDDSVIVHEMHHWIFEKSVRPFPPFGLSGGDHGHNQIRSKNGAITEGYAEYAELFWGAEYGSSDRLRGYGMTAFKSLGSRLGTVDEMDKDTPVNTFYLYGGLDTAPAPTFNTPNKGLEVEGYFANAVYQIHHALAEPGILFADAPTYWYPYNSFVTTEQSRRLSAILRKAMRSFPANPSSDQRKQGAELYLRQVLEAARADPSGLAQIVQSIYELNNQLMPTLTITEGTSSTTPGTAVGNSLNLQETDIKSLIVQVKDVLGQPLAGYNLNFQVTSAADWHLTPEVGGPAADHGAVPAAGLNRATNGNGIANISYEAPPIAAGHAEIVTVTYQPDFDRDASFAPPVRGDNLETTLRKLYLYELRAAAKVWAGTGNNLGAIITKSLTLNVQAP